MPPSTNRPISIKVVSKTNTFQRRLLYTTQMDCYIVVGSCFHYKMMICFVGVDENCHCINKEIERDCRENQKENLLVRIIASM